MLLLLTKVRTNNNDNNNKIDANAVFQANWPIVPYSDYVMCQSKLSATIPRAVKASQAPRFAELRSSELVSH